MRDSSVQAEYLLQITANQQLLSYWLVQLLPKARAKMAWKKNATFAFSCRIVAPR